MVISSCSLAEARLLLDNFLKASIDKVGRCARPGREPAGQAAAVMGRPGPSHHVTDRLGPAAGTTQSLGVSCKAGAMTY